MLLDSMFSIQWEQTRSSRDLVEHTGCFFCKVACSKDDGILKDVLDVGQCTLMHLVLYSSCNRKALSNQHLFLNFTIRFLSV
jgi:hypothetical protein